MKKIIALLLVAVMCFSLAACGGDNEASNNNDKEIDIKKVDVVGTWKNTSSKDHGFVMTVNEDGTGEIALSGEQTLSITWEKTDEEMVCNTGSKELTFKIRANDGIVEMVDKDGYYIVVSEQDYTNMIEVVEITADNWQDYLEIETYAAPTTNDFKEITHISISCALVLKDEYVDKFAGSDGAVETSYSGYNYFPIQYNAATKELTLGTPYTEQENEQKGHSPSTGTNANTEELSYYSEDGFRLGVGGGNVPDTLNVDGDVVTADVGYYETIEIARIQGTLYFKK